MQGNSVKCSIVAKVMEHMMYSCLTHKIAG
jgi:hypothetical protein